MKKLLSILLWGTPLFLAAQTDKKYDNSQNMDVVVNQEPFYPAGEQKMYEHVFYNLEYSADAQKAKVNGEVMLNFTVNADSSLSDFTIISSVGYGIDEDIIKLMKQLRFAPSLINGEAVNKNMLMSFPIEVE